MSEPAVSLASKVATALRDQLTFGELAPGQRLSEAAQAEKMAVSRNTLREAFRMMTRDGLFVHEANRGVFVATPSLDTIIDIYRVRRCIECPVLRSAHAHHPAVARMASAVKAARHCEGRQDWRGVGNANMDFHSAIVDLAGSPRLTAFYGNLAAELRLVFVALGTARWLHMPYIEMNGAILAQLQAGRAAEAADLLETYLLQSERAVLAAFANAANS
ncbi:GntR family transcriptional regulator [Pelagivirga sediminicola]|uniref:GntR family transcriptional regulator n=1 Tax=Pelagivirga sediminicola TaxID=2170575 RepID=A0A2T7G7D6_9RHOB|nr:GntR family transcriptional regulator [Pelagivirga sediminicola]PVA10341.1 GntR family transcriptional regulator [Pelagivirga sediminicola]